jgi:hypothetical protein
MPAYYLTTCKRLVLLFNFSTCRFPMCHLCTGVQGSWPHAPTVTVPQFEQEIKRKNKDQICLHYNLQGVIFFSKRKNIILKEPSNKYKCFPSLRKGTYIILELHWDPSSSSLGLRASLPWLPMDDENGWKRTEKTLTHFCCRIVFTGNESRSMIAGNGMEKPGYTSIWKRINMGRK